MRTVLQIKKFEILNLLISNKMDVVVISGLKLHESCELVSDEFRMCYCGGERKGSCGFGILMRPRV